ncbi:TPA: hypothetical protein HA278_04270, partial [Candidatus Woesearchaeota archaeon]|nr:hypothetical protein [Candidatus Woesearchaeota archaeon]
DVTYDQPYHFVQDLLSSVGFVAPDIFVDAEIIEELASRDEDRVYDERLHEIKNVIYQNIYNNLVYIYKSKGTEKAFRNLIRCFGVDDELIRLNLYADNETLKIENNVRYTAYRKHFADFSLTDSHEATVYQYYDATDPDTLSMIPATVNDEQDYLSFTVEAEVIFPKKLERDHPNYRTQDFDEASIFGMHEANAADQTDLAWTAIDAGNFQVYSVIVDDIDQEFNDAKFVLRSDGGFSAGIIELESPVYKDVYDNEKWNFAVRLVPNKPDLVDMVEGSDEESFGNPVDYTLEFYGVSTTLDVIEHEFKVTQNVDNAFGAAAMNAAKRLFIGTHREDFTGDVLMKSDMKISSVRFWTDYLDDDTITEHAKDASSFGRLDPYRNAYHTSDSVSPFNVPQIKTLALHWTLESVSNSDAAGRFVVDDFASGSLDLVASERYDWLGEIIDRQYPGRGDFFPASDSQVVDSEYVFTAKKQLPENLLNSDTVNILERDDDIFTRDSRPIKHFWAIEKSMAQTVSEEMIRMFSAINGFNNLIGEPANRYRMEYKELGKLRQIFFEHVENTPSIEKYVAFYKWLDSSINTMLQQLVPATAHFSEELRTMVESHVLERNKYWTKFPTMEFKQEPPEGNIRGIREMVYNWKLGRARNSVDETMNCLWWAERGERTPDVLETIRQRKVRDI